MREGSLPALPFRSKQKKQERTEVLVKQLLKVSMENNTLEAEILAKVQRGVSGMEDLMMFFPGMVSGFGGKKTWDPVERKNEEVAVFFGAARGKFV